MKFFEALLIVIFIVIPVINGILQSVKKGSQNISTTKPVKEKNYDAEVNEAATKTEEIQYKHIAVRPETVKEINKLKPDLKEEIEKLKPNIQKDIVILEPDIVVPNEANKKEKKDDWFSEGTLLKGIIMSEIMLPPLSKRRGR